MEVPVNSSDTKSAKYKEIREKKAYRIAENYYIEDHGKCVNIIRTSLKFVRKSERMYRNTT